VKTASEMTWIVSGGMLNSTSAPNSSRSVIMFVLFLCFCSEPKRVKCSVCDRRFRNLPALNGHMRLHGGYMKKVSTLLFLLILYGHE